MQLTSLESSSGSPRWFPDGRRIVFDSDKEGQLEIYVIDITTLVPHRLTNESSDDVTPSVSHDGKWIYFSSKRTGKLEVWRMLAEGGEAVQMTHQGGYLPFESPGGKVVYYQKDQDVWNVPVTGGEESRVLGPIEGPFAVGTDGIYFIEADTSGSAGSASRIGGLLIKGNSLKFF